MEKDNFLYANTHVQENKEVYGNDITDFFQNKKRIRTDDEIENIPFFKVIINSGANVLREYKSSNNVLDIDVFNKIEGDIVEIDNNDVYQKNQFFDYGGNTFIPILNNWKLYTYDDYLKFVDIDTTSHLRDIVNLKNNNPLKYYENMVRRDEQYFAKKIK